MRLDQSINILRVQDMYIYTRQMGKTQHFVRKSNAITIKDFNIFLVDRRGKYIFITKFEDSYR